MRTLHVAALPFPSPQGTQALLHAMLCALGANGHDTHLLCYAHGSGRADGPYTIHRAPRVSRSRSLRSGPTLEKLWLDADLARELGSLTRSLRPDAIVAHHVEASACAALVGRAPQLFVSHTSLAAELPTYFGAAFAAPLRFLGSTIDRVLVRGAHNTSAVSPRLAELLSELSGVPVAALPLPWPVAAPIEAAERESARRELGYTERQEVALYAGNLDAYQGIEPLIEALAKTFAERPQLRWLIATAAATRALSRELERVQVRGRTQFVALESERARRLVHAAADLALVPRRSAGGVPIKLLDACARGVPVVAARIAVHEQELAQHCEVVDGSSPSAWRAAIVHTLASPDLAHARAQRARAHVASACTARAFVSALEAAVADAAAHSRRVRR